MQKDNARQAFTSCVVHTGWAGCAQFLSPAAQSAELHEPPLPSTVQAWLTAHCLSLVHAIGSYTHTCFRLRARSSSRHRALACM
jgi:hypothetical protein